MVQTNFSTAHVRLEFDKSFDEFTASLDRQLGQFEQSVLSRLDAGSSPEEARSQLERMTGTSGLMLFNKQDHGRALQIVGKRRQAIQYVLGNPLIAIEMTQHAIGAALYAPLRVLVYENESGQACVEYDLPSTLFGQFGNANVDQVAKSLDHKLDVWIANAAR